MISIEQLKLVEYLATGHTISESAVLIGVNPNTARGWLRNDPDVVLELSRATDMFAKECLKGRSRAYRVITKKITDTILDKIEEDKLKAYEIDELIKMLDKSVISMNNDESPKKLTNLTAIQNNIQINATIEHKLQEEQFVKKFAELLDEFTPEDLENVVEAKAKAENDAKFQERHY